MLWDAQFARPLPGFETALDSLRPVQAAGADTKKPEQETQQLCTLQSETATSLPVDFYSFRRAYATALARSGVNMQAAMALAGHKSSATHIRYVRLTEVLEVPVGVVPALATQGAQCRNSGFSVRHEGFEPSTLGFGGGEFRRHSDA